MADSISPVREMTTLQAMGPADVVATEDSSPSTPQRLRAVRVAGAFIAKRSAAATPRRHANIRA
jgi:hypothetical protein